MAIHGSFTFRNRSHPSKPSSTEEASAAVPVATAVSVRNVPISYHLLTVNLDLSRLRSFLLHVIPQHCPKDFDLIHDAYHSFNAVNTKVMKNNTVRKGLTRLSRGGSSHMVGNGVMNSTINCKLYETCHIDLSNCSTTISRFLSSWTNPPAPQILSEALFLTGCINETLQQTHQAKKSYITALWIITAKSDVHTPTEALATTLHCLGRTYGALEQHKQAKNILRKAQQQYLLLNVHQEHAVMVDVAQLISFHRTKIEDKSRADRLNGTKYWSSSSSISISLQSTLYILFEDDEIE